MIFISYLSVLSMATSLALQKVVIQIQFQYAEITLSHLLGSNTLDTFIWKGFLWLKLVALFGLSSVSDFVMIMFVKGSVIHTICYTFW